MAKITAEMKEVAAKAQVFALATATKDGKPNVVPIAFSKVFSDDELLLVDNWMGKTRQNIEANPIVAVSAWCKRGRDRGRGYQFKGKARVESSGKIFEEAARWVETRKPKWSLSVAKAVVIVKVDEIYNLDVMPGAVEFWRKRVG